MRRARYHTLGCALGVALACATLAASEPAHYMYVNRDHDRLADSTLLATPNLAGAQVKYTWRELEPTRDHYDLHLIHRDLARVEHAGKRLVVQLQDASFDERINTPDYLASDWSFHGGSARKVASVSDDDSLVRFDGWVARRWDPAVQARWAALLQALGDSLDGRIEAVVLSESAVQFGATGRYVPDGFTPEAYVRGIEAQITAARHAFPRTRVIQYANFMPGEWLPKTDHGYLRAVIAHAESIGVGIGGPDLMPTRKELRNHAYPLIASRPAGVIAGLAVQNGNLAALDPVTKQPLGVERVAAFARDSLRLDYVFWGTQEPWWSRDVLPWLRALGAPGQKPPAPKP